MSDLTHPRLRIVESFPEPDFTALQNAVFVDFGERSTLLADVLAEEAARHPRQARFDEQRSQKLRIAVFMENKIAGWSYSRGEGDQLHMVNSGVSPEVRRRGIYTRLVEATIGYANANGFSKVFSRHVPNNNAVIIPKLRLGFLVSGFEYSEIYGPLVHLTYLIGKRKDLYKKRSIPIIPADR